MRKLAVTLAALALSATPSLAADPVFHTSDLNGAYTLSFSGNNVAGNFNMTGVIRFDGAGHIINTTATPSYAINEFIGTAGQEEECRYNLRPNPSLNVSVSSLDSSVRIPVMMVPFTGQPKDCVGPNTWAGTMVSPSEVNVNFHGGGQAVGMLKKQHNP